MADVTFGVKVTEEMKQELSELMKDTGVSGKSFMQMLLASYKLEQTKQNEESVYTEVKELQVLLSRIQNIYMHLAEKAQLKVQTMQKDWEKESESKEEQLEELQLQIKQLEKQNKIEQETIQEKEKLYKKAEQKIMQLEKTMKEVKQQHQIQQNLYDKYEKEIQLLQKENMRVKELEEKMEELQKSYHQLKEKYDTSSSEKWFLQREIEKAEKEKQTLKENDAIILENKLLQQKLVFSEEIARLKEEYTTLQKEYLLQLQKENDRKIKEKENIENN